MTEPEAFNELRCIDTAEKVSYARKGKICLDVRNGLLHQNRIDPETGMPCSFSRWVRLSATWSYASCFAAMRDMESLSDVPAADLAQVPAGNFPILKQLSTAVRNQPAVLQAAKTKHPDELIEHIKRDHPNQHLESRKTLRFVAEESQAAEIEEAIALAMEHGAANRTEALLAMAIDYKASMRS